MAGSEKRLGRRRTDHGAAAVEFALAFPLLIMVLIGMVTTGMVFFDHTSASNAVREAARYGAAADASTASTWATSVRDRVIDTYFNGVYDPTNAQICVDLSKATSATAATPLPGAAITGTECGTAPGYPDHMTVGSCVVRVWMTRPEKIDLVVFPSLSFDISAASVAYYGRTFPTTGLPTCSAS